MYNKYNNPFQIDDNARSNPNPNVSLARTTRTRYDTLTARATRTEQARASAVRQFDSRPPLLYLRCFYFHLPLSRSTTPGLERSHSLTPDYPAWILRPTDLPPSPSLLPPLGKLTRGGRRASERASDNRARETSDGARRDRERGTKTEREGERATLARFLSYLFGVVLGCAARRTSGKMAAGSEPRCRCSRPLLPQQRRARTGGAGGRGEAAAAEQEEEEAEE